MTLRWFAAPALALFLVSSAAAGEEALMHCFAFTEIEDASDADWEAFRKATDELPSKIEGLEKVWHGELRRPLRVFNRGSEEPLVRQHGVCMEMRNEAALEAYAEHPAHEEWVTAYEKVRQPGTTTFDILGQ